MFYLSQTEDYSDNSEKLLRRNMVFSSFMSGQSKEHHTEYNPSRFQKSNWCIPNESAWPWHLGRESNYQRRMSQKGRHLIFIF